MGIIETAEVVNVPPVGVGKVIDEGSFLARRGVVELEAMEVNRGPEGPIV